MQKSILFIFLSLLSLRSYAQHSGHNPVEPKKVIQEKSPLSPEDCGEMMVWDKMISMCIVIPDPAMPMGMWMIHGNGFLVQSIQEGPRGRNRISSPNMLMADVGNTFGNHYLDVNLMLTVEKWTFPKEGYPELLQIGEKNEDEEPYIDAQHPHSSPIMGLTFSDTIRIGEGKDYLRVFFAPRGQATDGPIAFMHRPTGMINPDAPLGHHIGQDVSHITSTVLGTSVSKGRVRIEGSLFNGTEPEPAKVDLPLGPLNSYGVRLGYEFSDDLLAMMSAAEITDPEPHDPLLKKVWRYSASVYNKHHLWDHKVLDDALIYGHVNNYDHVSVLRSVLYEFWLHENEIPHQYWGRIEFVERTASELNITGTPKADEPKWVNALTAGYTYRMKLTNDLEGGVGASVTKNFLPSEFRSAYGGDPLSGKIFLQISGMKMGEL